MIGRPAPWLWRIVDTTAGTVVACGVQHTRPYATPAEVARERMACHAYPLLVAGRVDDLAGLSALVCRVWRDTDVERFGETSGMEWIPAEPRQAVLRLA